MNQELSTTEAKIEQAAKSHAKQKFNSEHFRESCAKHFTAGATFAITDPSILQSLLQPFAEWIRSREGEQKMALNDHDWYWDSDLDGAAPLSDEELAEQYIQFITDKSKEDC